MSNDEKKEKKEKRLFPDAEDIPFDYDIAVDQMRRIIEAMRPFMERPEILKNPEQKLALTIYQSFYAVCDSSEVEGKYKGFINDMAYAIKTIDRFISSANPGRSGGNIFAYNTKKQFVSLYKELKQWILFYEKFIEAVKDKEFINRLEQSERMLKDTRKQLTNLMKIYKEDIKK